MAKTELKLHAVVSPTETVVVSAYDKDSKAFVLGFPGVDQVMEADYLGVESGYNTDKLANIGYTTSPAKNVHAPVINEFRLSLECEIVHTVTVGSHTQVTGEVKRIIADENILNEKNKIDLGKLKPIIYDEEQFRYLSVGEKIADAFRPGAEMKKKLQ